MENVFTKDMLPGRTAPERQRCQNMPAEHRAAVNFYAGDHSYQVDHTLCRQILTVRHTGQLLNYMMQVSLLTDLTTSRTRIICLGDREKYEKCVHQTHVTWTYRGRETEVSEQADNPSRGMAEHRTAVKFYAGDHN